MFLYILMIPPGEDVGEGKNLENMSQTLAQLCCCVGLRGVENTCCVDGGVLKGIIPMFYE